MHISDCDNCALLTFARPLLYAALPPPHYFLTNASVSPIWYLGWNLPTALFIPGISSTFEIHLLLSYIRDPLSFLKALLPLLHGSGPRQKGQLCPYSAPPDATLMEACQISVSLALDLGPI